MYLNARIKKNKNVCILNFYMLFTYLIHIPIQLRS